MTVLELARTIVEECWADEAGLDRMESLVAAGYVHHSAFGDVPFAGFREGIAWVDGVFAERSYRVEHIVAEGDLAAVYLTWSATRRADGSAVSGRGAYHLRVTGGRVAEDWDVFFPMS
ncbi:MAG TPA: nuclear transport factor 2 family protein [Gaiellaceae bacterium]|nr:nuclear transport factor 2 family protein [Gaiellaceae bacterium]